MRQTDLNKISVSQGERKEKMLLVFRQMLSAVFFVWGLGQALFALLADTQNMQSVSLYWCLAGCICCGICSLSRRFCRFAPLLPVLGAVLAVLVSGGQSAVRGMAGFFNSVISRWNIKYEDGRSLFLTGQISERDIRCFIILAVLLLTAAVWEIIRKNAVVCAVVLTAACVLLGVLVGKISPASYIAMFIGVSGIWTMQTCSDRGGRSLLWTAVCSLVFIVLIFALPSEKMRGVEAWQQWGRQEVHRLRFGEDTLPEGDLYRAHTLSEGDEETLIVTAEQKKNLYLRGFTGDIYKDGRWKAIAKSAFGGERAGMLAWLKENRFYTPVQYQGYCAVREDAPAANRVNVENVGACRAYIYLPYGAGAPDKKGIYQFRDSQYRSARLFGCREYTFTEYSDMLPGELQKTENWVEQPAGALQEQYVQAEAVYRGFVYQNYLETDKSLGSLMEKLFWKEPMEMKGVYAATDRIRTVLSNCAAYQSRPEVVPTDADPIRWFLTESHRGNAALFASAAVQAYRVYGIPARYAEGYLLKEEQIHPGEEQAVHLTNRDSHAWVEVYIDGMGWIPVDVTPGFYYDAYSLQQMVDRPQGTEQTAVLEDDGTKADSALDDAAAGSRDREQNEKQKAGLVLIGMLVLLAVLAVGLFLYLELRRLWILGSMRTRFRAMREDARTDLICRAILFRLNLMGIQVCLGWRPEDTEEKLLEYEGFYRGEYSRVSSLMEKYYYGGETLKPYEQRVLCGFWKKLCAVEAMLPLFLRLKIRYTALKEIDVGTNQS